MTIPSEISQDVPGNEVLVNGVLVKVKRVFINIAASQTDAVLVAAVASKAIMVVWLDEQCGDIGTTIVYNSKPGGAGVACSGLHANSSNGGRVKGVNGAGWFQTSVGEGLTCTTGAGSSHSIELGYVEV